MKDKEDVLRIQELNREGLSNRAIGRKLGMDRRTVKRYLDNPNSAGEFQRHKPVSSKLRVREMKKERQRIAYKRFETEPGRQAQVDYGEFIVDNPNGESIKLYLFSMILGYSRMQYAELTEKCDLSTLLDSHIRAFEYFGGVPNEILYDRMKNVYLGKLAGKTKFNTSLINLAVHYNFKPMVASAYSPWVKGKVERPFSFIREGFWRGYGFVSLQNANSDLLEWVEMKAERIHGATYEKVIDRFEREKPHLWELPQGIFDTVSFLCKSYVVPHTLVGKQVMLRVKESEMRIFNDNELLVRYEIPSGKGEFVEDPKFYRQLSEDRQLNRRKYRGKARRKGRATISPTVPGYAVEVENRSVNDYEVIL